MIFIWGQCFFFILIHLQDRIADNSIVDIYGSVVKKNTSIWPLIDNRNWKYHMNVRDKGQKDTFTASQTNSR